MPCCAAGEPGSTQVAQVALGFVSGGDREHPVSESVLCGECVGDLEIEDRAPGFIEVGVIEGDELDLIGEGPGAGQDHA